MVMPQCRKLSTTCQTLARTAMTIEMTIRMIATTTSNSIMDKPRRRDTRLKTDRFMLEQLDAAVKM